MWVCPECRKALRELAPDEGYYCVFCHLSVTLSHAGGYALVLKDDEKFHRTPGRVQLDSLKT